MRCMKLWVVAILGTLLAIVVLPLGGCATQAQKTMAQQAAQPTIQAITDAHAAAVRTQVAADSTATSAHGLAAALHSATTQPASIYAPQADVVASDASATQRAAENTVTQTVTASDAAKSLPAKIVKAEQVNVAVGKAQIKSGLFYKVGRFIVITVFLLLVLGGLIVFSESGIAGTLGVKWPILATVIFKPMEWIGSLLGKLWGYIERGAIWAWDKIKSLSPPKSTTVS